MTLDEHFRAIGEAALRATPNVKQLAMVNHLDNFTTAVSTVVQDAIIEALDDLADKCREVISNAEGIEFPGMY